MDTPSRPRLGGRRTGLTRRAQARAQETPPAVFEEGRECSACTAVSPQTAAVCIVCGAPFGGPLRYQVIGSVMPALEITLEPGQRVYARTDSLGWMTEPIEMRTVLPDSPWALVGRLVSGMTPAVTEYIARDAPGVVAFTAEIPGAIVPLEVSYDRAFVVQKGAFLAAQDTVSVNPYFNQDLGATFLGGEGYVLQRLSGAGTAFAEVDGEAVQYELQPGQTLRVEPGHVAVFEASVSFSIQMVRGVRNVVFGEGLFLAQLRGPGRVWLQTMPLAQLAAALAARLPRPER